MAADTGSGCSGSTNSILTFSLGSHQTIASGNFAPTDDLTGASTLLDYPYVGNVDPNSDEWVANGDNASVTAYAVLKNGNVSPTHDIAGAATTLVDPSGVAVSENSKGVNNYVYVSDYAEGAIDVFSASSTGNVAPLYRITGASTGLEEPWGITLDSAGNIWVADFEAGAVYKFAPVPGGSGDIDEAPEATIRGGSTTLEGPSDVYIDSSGHVWVADYEGLTIDEFAAGTTTGAPMRTLAAASDPTGVAVDNGGNVYGAGYSSAIWIWPASTLNFGSNPVATMTIAGGSTDVNCVTGVRVFSTSGTNDV
jgi:streptogramin lyase